MTNNSSSYSTDSLVIPKLLQKVTLWVHPEGKVLGSLFIREQSHYHAGNESPIEVLNSSQDFIVLKREDTNELRFYNKTSIIRIEYNVEQILVDGDTSIECNIHMMDGSLLNGFVKENLPQTHARLFDYINDPSNKFLKIYLTEHEVIIINKSYVIRITPLKE